MAISAAAMIVLQGVATASFSVPQRVNTIGRSDRNGIILLHPSVSKFHAAIIYRDGVPFIVDQGSTNGTFLKETRLAEDQWVQINAGDTIRFGLEEFTVLMFAVFLERETSVTNPPVTE